MACGRWAAPGVAFSRLVVASELRMRRDTHDGDFGRGPHFDSRLTHRESTKLTVRARFASSRVLCKRLSCVRRALPRASLSRVGLRGFGKRLKKDGVTSCTPPIHLSLLARAATSFF